MKRDAHARTDRAADPRRKRSAAQLYRNLMTRARRATSHEFTQPRSTDSRAATALPMSAWTGRADALSDKGCSTIDLKLAILHHQRPYSRTDEPSRSRRTVDDTVVDAQGDLHDL